jgi:PAS domain S-box-containing protein
MKYIAGQTAQSGLNANHIRSDNSDCSILHTRIESLEQALHLSEDKFNSFFKKSKTPLFITDSDCRFVEFNQAMIDMLEYAEKEISALKIADIIDNPDDYHHFQRKIIHNGHICGYKAKLRKNSGDYVDCTITADIKIDAFGFFAGLQGSINDITSQKHIEQKLARRDELQKLIMLTSTEFLRLMTDK